MSTAKLNTFTPSQQHRLYFVLDLFDGFEFEIDANRLRVGITFARSGIKTGQIPEDLVDLFASYYLGAEEAGAWKRTSPDGHRLEAISDIERVMAESLQVPVGINLQPVFDWYAKATGDFGDDFMNGDLEAASGWDQLHDLIGSLGSDLGIQDSDDSVPLLYLAPQQAGERDGDPMMDASLYDIGEAVIKAIEQNSDHPALKGWHPTDCPSEVVLDLLNHIDEIKHFNGLTPAEAERLAMLGEESAEVIKAVCKILRHGYESHNPDRPEDGTNREQLQREMADVVAVNLMMQDGDDIHTPRRAEIDPAAQRKLRYAHHQDQADA